MNILIYVFQCTYTIHFYIFKNEIARKQGTYMFSFSRYCHTVFQMVLPLPLVGYMSFSCTKSLTTLGLVSLYNFSHSVGDVFVSHCDFNLHFLVTM